MRFMFITCLLFLTACSVGPSYGVTVVENMVIDSNQNMWISGYTSTPRSDVYLSGNTFVVVNGEYRHQWFQVCPISTATGMSPNVLNPILTCHLVTLDDYTARYNKELNSKFNKKMQLTSEHQNRLNDASPDLEEEDDDEGGDEE